MKKLHVIAIENPFLICYNGPVSLSAWVYSNKELCLYSSFGELISTRKYKEYIPTLQHAIDEGRFEWADLWIEQGQILSRNIEDEVLLDNKPVTYFVEPAVTMRSFSYTTLKLFSEFLKLVDKDNMNKVEALNNSLVNGYLRKQVEDIIVDDTIKNPSKFDREIIIRSRIEGTNYIVNQVKKKLEGRDSSKFIFINLFFRRIFNLEKLGYISFDAANGGLQ